jgi:hypothetical protein
MSFYTDCHDRLNALLGRCQSLGSLVDTILAGLKQDFKDRTAWSTADKLCDQLEQQVVGWEKEFRQAKGEQDPAQRVNV